MYLHAANYVLLKSPKHEFQNMDLFNLNSKTASNLYKYGVFCGNSKISSVLIQSTYFEPKGLAISMDNLAFSTSRFLKVLVATCCSN